MPDNILILLSEYFPFWIYLNSFYFYHFFFFVFLLLFFTFQRAIRHHNTYEDIYDEMMEGLGGEVITT